MNYLPGRAEPMVPSLAHPIFHAVPQLEVPADSEVIAFGMGCFWGAERIFYSLPVVSTAVGYQGGYSPNPTYEEVCTGLTGHAEVVRVVYRPTEVELETLLAAFWENHDPTTPDRQGNDIGTQYRSAIYANTAAQLQTAQASATKYQATLTAAGYGTISTEIGIAAASGDGKFYFAEDYHQGYLAKNPNGYCNHGFCQVAYPEPATQ